MFLLFSLLLLAPLGISGSVQIGLIRNACWNQSATSTQNGIASCNECVCMMMMPFSTVLGFNCFLANLTCHLFSNYSIDSMMREFNDNTTFYFRVLPSITTPPSFTTAANQLEITTQIMSFTQIFWSFDNDTSDFYNVYNGTIMNNASYLSPGITGYGSSLFLQYDLNQYVNVSSVPLDLSNTSFTFELWINANTLNVSYFYGLIGQCTSSSGNMCLHLALRDRYPYLGFFQNDCAGGTILNTSTWYHIAFVYSYELRRQTIYLNGFVDGEKYSADPFQGNSETPLTIGQMIPAERRWSFDGTIDQVSFVNRVKSDIEILDDATLVVHYSFDSNLLDSGPMKINGTGVNVSFVNQSLEFAFNSSNVQATGFTLLGTSNQPYSIALWIYPYSTTGGCLIYLWATSTSAWCLPLLGLSTSGSIIAQQYDGSNVISISSKTILPSTWTHIAYTYSINIGIQLYINGLLANTSIPFSYSAMSQPGSITLGFLQASCNWQPNSIVKTQYYGLINEFYLYSRQLNITEIQKLATR